MQSITQGSYLVNFAERLQIKETVLLLAAAVAVPLIIHLLPAINGQPSGAYFLPVFYAPLIAILLFRFHTALITAAFAPVLNYLITGNPQFNLVQIICLELVIFVSICYLLNKIEKFRLTAGLLSYLLTMFVLFFVITLLNLQVPGNDASSFIINSALTGIPGIIVLGLINIMSIKFFSKK
jgi:membrane-associated HD superfamily phosphohydrolase